MAWGIGPVMWELVVGVGDGGVGGYAGFELVGDAGLDLGSDAGFNLGGDGGLAFTAGRGSTLTGKPINPIIAVGL